MPSLPSDPSCVVRAGETIEVVEDYWLMPDGTTRETIAGCDISPDANMLIIAEDEDDPEQRHSPPAVPLVPVPVDVSPDVSPTDDSPSPPDAIAPDDQHTATVAMLPTPPRLPPESATQTTTVVVAVAAVGAAGWLGVKALGHLANGGSSSGSQNQPEQQRKEEERKEREQCATASNGMFNDFRARVADFKTRRLPEVVDPVDLWQRCDLLEAQADHFARWLRARAKTRRA